jgi:ABC-type polysaccharide/polyol phosphate export permease
MTSFRALFASAWMGVQHDLAWTSTPISLAIRAISPFASAMTVSIMYWFGSTYSGGAVSFNPTQLAYVLVGSSLYAQVAAYAWVPTVAIAEGKNLAVFPHIYLTARSTALYVAGRTLSAFVISTTASVAALAVAYGVLESFLRTTIPLTVTPLTALMVGAALIADIPAALGLGYILGAYSLYASKFEWSLPGYIAGLLMVFSGALFPTKVLPYPLSTGATYLPFTQFIAAARVAIVPGISGNYLYSMALCLLGGAVFLGVGLMIYFWAEKRARKDGVIDRRMA